MARLLAPGTLVEEAAIRRQIFVADQLRDDKTVQSLARQYLDRFRHSVYAGNFRDRFAAALSHMDFVNDPAQFPRLDDMLASVEPAGRAELYLTIALAGVVSGRTNAANLASTRVIALSAPASPIQTRARLYRAAALVASAKTFDAARTDYATVDRKTLSPSDQALFDAVGEAIAAVRSGTEITAKPPPPGTDPDQPSTVMTRAATTLKTIDALLAAK
jgi:chemotaxis protein MotC